MGLGTSYSQWSKQLPDSLPPVILACGPETTLKSEMIEELSQTFSSDNREIISLYADETDPGSVVQEISSQGLFSESKWVVLKQLGLSSSGGYQLERYYDDLTDYLQDPDPDSVLILLDQAHPYQKGRKTGSLARAVENAGGDVVVFWEPFERELYQRLRSLFKKHEIEWEQGTIQRLVEKSKGKLPRIEQEAEKLVDRFDQGDRISLADVEQIVSEEEASDSYQELKESMLTGTASDIMKSLDDFYRQSSSGKEVAITHTILNYLHEIREIKRLISQGHSLEQALEEKNIPTSKGIKKRYERALKRVKDRLPKDFYRNGYDLLRDVKYGKEPINRRSLEKFMLEAVPSLRTY